VQERQKVHEYQAPQEVREDLLRGKLAKPANLARPAKPAKPANHAKRAKHAKVASGRSA